jgi:uncharacterized cysteine cluster protein YcgN (CxxCxxCC family)
VPARLLAYFTVQCRFMKQAASACNPYPVRVPKGNCVGLKSLKKFCWMQKASIFVFTKSNSKNALS